jgi:hypothetical protein
MRIPDFVGSRRLPKIDVTPRPRFHALERLLSRVSPSPTSARAGSQAISAIGGAVLEAETAPRIGRDAGALLEAAEQTPALQPALPVFGSDLGWPTDFFSHFILGDCLGQGSFGTVYTASGRL